MITYANEAYTSPLKYHIAVDRVRASVIKRGGPLYLAPPTWSVRFIFILFGSYHTASEMRRTKMRGLRFPSL